MTSSIKFEHTYFEFVLFVTKLILDTTSRTSEDECKW
jgi:hypothetical protein